MPCITVCVRVNALHALQVSTVNLAGTCRRVKYLLWLLHHEATPLHSLTLRWLLPVLFAATDFEYEVQWQGLSSIKFNRWIPRAELIDNGFKKFVFEYDSKKAAAALGNDARPLTKENVQKFLQDFGLDPEFGTHSNIRGLSGGQKVKLVLAAAMWNNPHLLIMVRAQREERGWCRGNEGLVHACRQLWCPLTLQHWCKSMFPATCSPSDMLHTANAPPPPSLFFLSSPQDPRCACTFVASICPKRCTT
jgi:hypothetical protein